MMQAKSLPAVTLATRVYEPEGTAAAYRLGNLTRELERRGFSVTVLTTRSKNAPKSTKRVRRWPVFRDRSGSVRGYLQYASFDIPLFFRLIFGPRADAWVVEPPPTTGVAARVASRVRRTPYIYYSADVTSSAVRSVGVNRVVIRVVTDMERWVLDGAATVLAVSDGVQLELEELGTDSSKIVMVGTGIDTDQFRDHGAIEGRDYPYFVYAGTMSEFQGAHIFVEAFERVSAVHPSVRLIMFGGGVDMDDLRLRASTLGDRVEFPGFVSADAVARSMRGAVAGLASVRPGRGYDFAAPTKTLVSVACGTPVIFAGVGPMQDLVAKNDLGWSVSWDAAQVAEAMESALAYPHRRVDSARVEWLARNFSLRAVATKAAIAVENVIASHRDASPHAG